MTMNTSRTGVLQGQLAPYTSTRLPSIHGLAATAAQSCPMTLTQARAGCTIEFHGTGIYGEPK